VRSLLVTAAAALVVAGSAAGAAPTTVARSVPGTHLRIALPASWRLVDHATALTLIKRIGTLNPQLASFVSVLAKRGSLIRLVAIDPNAQRGFATNANVVVEQAPAASLTQTVALELAGVRQVLHPTDVRQSTVRVAGMPAVSLTFEARFNEPSGATLVAERQIYLQSAGTVYAVTLTTLPSERAAYAPTFAAIVNSLRFTQ